MGHRCHHGLDPDRRLGVGVRGGGPLHRRGVGVRGQDRRPVRRLQPVYDAVIDRWGRLDADLARGLSLRHAWGPQYRSGRFLGSICWLGIADDAAFLGEPETNGCAERWFRTLNEQCLWAELHDTVDQLRQAVTDFVDRYNTSWLIQRQGHLTPKSAYAGSSSGSSGMINQAQHCPRNRALFTCL
jgi:transposase InsO family protein